MKQRFRSIVTLGVYALAHPQMALRRLVEGQTKFSEAPYKLIAQLGANADLVIEAGAADGADTQKLSALLPSARILALEPVPSAFNMCFERCTALRNVSVLNCALSEEVGTLTLYLSTSTSGPGQTDSSSALQPTEHMRHFPEVEFNETIEVPSVTLDAVISEQEEANFVVLWLDLQGLELRVLAASNNARKRAQVIYMEVCRRPLYSGAPSYSEVQKRMTQWGYSEVFARVGRVSGNALFIRRS